MHVSAMESRLRSRSVHLEVRIPGEGAWVCMLKECDVQTKVDKAHSQEIEGWASVEDGYAVARLVDPH